MLATENLEVSSISSRLRCACLQQRKDNNLLKSALENMTAKGDALQLNIEALQHFHKRASDQQQDFQAQSEIQSENILKEQGGGGGMPAVLECGSELQNKEDEKDCTGDTIFASSHYLKFPSSMNTFELIVASDEENASQVLFSQLDMSLEAHSLKSMLLEESLSQVIQQSAWKEEFRKHDMLRRQ
jgi:hypothetical protein